MSNPSNLKYTAEHEWLDTAQSDGQGTARIGVTAHAADALGDVVFLELPEVGASLSAGEACGEIESTKSVSDLYAPADGEVVEVNDAVVADPSLVNSDPFGAGWLFVMKVSGSPELLDAASYDQLIEG
jgi:glycine cleavage system H protein